MSPAHSPTLRLAKPEVPGEAGLACVGVGRGAAAGLPGNHHVHRLCLGSGGWRSPSARSWAGRSLRPQEGSVSWMPPVPREDNAVWPVLLSGEGPRRPPSGLELPAHNL